MISSFHKDPLAHNYSSSLQTPEATHVHNIQLTEHHSLSTVIYNDHLPYSKHNRDPFKEDCIVIDNSELVILIFIEG